MYIGIYVVLSPLLNTPLLTTPFLTTHLTTHLSTPLSFFNHTLVRSYCPKPSVKIDCEAGYACPRSTITPIPCNNTEAATQYCPPRYVV